MRKEISLEGRTALVTGGGTGIGFGIAQELLDAGARVILAGRRAEVLREAARGLGNVEIFPLDITEHETTAAKVEELCARFGAPDILVNNAGIQNNKPALEYTHEEFARLFDTNVFGTYVLTREIAGRMVQKGGGSIVFITSSAAHIGVTKNLPYSGTKGALSAMVRAFASELSPLGVRVNAVAPGWIETDLVKESLARVPERRSMVERRAMLGRLGTPQDVGMAVAFLASDAAAYLTAVEIKVDGGIAASL